VRRSRGFSILEVLVALVLAAMLTVIATGQVVSLRRRTRMIRHRAAVELRLADALERLATRDRSGLRDALGGGAPAGEVVALALTEDVERQGLHLLTLSAALADGHCIVVHRLVAAP
jgi:prepilin-type N-terminal cleavage/methylation domain-containing protein